MATLVASRSITKAYHRRPLFAGLSLHFADEDRCGLIGPNGAGKSTLLKILAGLETVDEGEVERRRDARVVYAPQVDDLPADTCLLDVIAERLPVQLGDALQRQTQAQIALGKHGFDALTPGQPEAYERLDTALLSGGWRKRLSLTCALASEPDLLLLDEPTNHLDLDGIEWLENSLKAANFAYVVVSHDRWFLERIAGRMIELNATYPEGYFSVSGSYSFFLEKRQDMLAAQQRQQASLAGRVRREIEWLKHGPKARTTKAKYRVDQAESMIDGLKELRERNTSGQRVGIDFDSTGRRSRKLLVAEGLSKAYGERRLFSSLDLWFSPGTRLGLLGPNGSGKSTLIRILAGELEPDSGTLFRADGLQTVVFDQQREQLPKEMPLREALAGKGDIVVFRERSIHVSAWAHRFLFRTEQLNMPVGDLSGGEQARILIARLMVQPADLLILDEPTNDLDIPSLEILEESLVDFPGALVLVTHDRMMLDRVCEGIVLLDGKGHAGLYADVPQCLDARRKQLPKIDKEKPRKLGKSNKQATSGDDATQSKPKKLTYAEKLELDGIEAQILAAEERAQACRMSAEDPAIASDHVELTRRCEKLHSAEQEVARLYARWEQLEARNTP